jgi:hypothetical protein
MCPLILQDGDPVFGQSVPQQVADTICGAFPDRLAR